jgi:hypothetical protein
MEVIRYKETGSLIEYELEKLEKKLVLLDGKLIKPSQCYRFSSNPPYILYNTNCPEELMEEIETILLKYKDKNEDRA